MYFVKVSKKQISPYFEQTVLFYFSNFRKGSKCHPCLIHGVNKLIWLNTCG